MATMHIKTTWFGIFILDGKNVVKHKLFPKNPEKIAMKLLEISEGRLLAEERMLASEYENLTTSDARIARLGIPISECPVEIDAEKYGYDKELLRKATIELAKMKMRKCEKDIHIIQRVRIIEMLNRLDNMLFEVLWDWYAHHFPELEGFCEREDLPQLISLYGHREKVCKSLGISVDFVGEEFGEAELRDVQEVARLVLSIREVREKLKKSLESEMKEYAPELSNVAGYLIGAKLIAKAGGLKNLAMLPSSTIQILGAEKAFFRYLRRRGKMPKHGLIYQHPSIKHAKKSERGKASRALAAKIAIAARKDAFGKPEATNYG